MTRTITAFAVALCVSQGVRGYESPVADPPATHSPVPSAAASVARIAFVRAIRKQYDLEEKAFAGQDANVFISRFYTADAISVGQGEGIFIGRDKIHANYDADVKGNLVKIRSVHTYVNGNAGWDFTDYHVVPIDLKARPFYFVVLYLWAKIDGRWVCKGDFYVSGSFSDGLAASP